MDPIAHSVPPAHRAHVAALEEQLARKRRCGNVALNYDMWDRWGSSHATPEQRAEMEADMAAAVAERVDAERILVALVERLRREAPEAVLAWVDAHDFYLATFIAECAQKPEDSQAQTGKFVAERERIEWGEVRRGERAFVEENFFYVTMNAERYRALFGVEP